MEKIVKAVLGNREKSFDPAYELEFADDLKKRFSQDVVRQVYAQYLNDESEFAKTMRRIIMRSLCKSFGNGVIISPNVRISYPETVELGDNVFLGLNTTIQGRFDGTCRIGDFTWIGPHCFIDARDITIGKYVGIGPGVNVIGSQHSAEPIDIPIVKTNLIIKSIIIKDEADIGAGTVILPGVTIGKGCIIGANAVVNRDVADYSVAVGVPAKEIKNRKGSRK